MGPTEKAFRLLIPPQAISLSQYGNFPLACDWVDWLILMELYMSLCCRKQLCNHARFCLP